MSRLRIRISRTIQRLNHRAHMLAQPAAYAALDQVLRQRALAGKLNRADVRLHFALEVVRSAA